MYVLSKIGVDLYFKGYEGKGKGPKPTWTDNFVEAIQYSFQDAICTQRRLLCQSQFTVLTLV